MKKQYIEPSTAVYTFSITNLFMEGSTADLVNDDKDPATPLSPEAQEDNGFGDNDARFGGGTSIWDNAW